MTEYRKPRSLLGTRYGGRDTRVSNALRNYDAIRNPGARPSAEFDWEPALVGFARLMAELGYPLSTQQQQRIDDHG
jgi:hypothetical protein